MRSIRYFLPAVSWFLFTTFLLMIPGNDLPKNPFLAMIYFDKWVHIGLFGLLNFFIIWGYMRINRKRQKVFLLTTLGCIAYGIVMEFVQKYFAVDRSFDLTDILADATGAFLAYFAALYFQKKNRPL